MDGPNFLSWFNKLFLPAVQHLTETGPVLLFLDGHHSHISLELIRKARENNITIMCLPPNTTHLLQPLDLSVFAPLKKAWKSILKQYKLETRGQTVSKEVFPGLIKKLWDASFKPEHCVGGFHGAGLVPLSREHVLGKLLPTPSVGEKNDKFKCTRCGHKMPTTPVIKTHIVSYFAGIWRFGGRSPK